MLSNVEGEFDFKTTLLDQFETQSLGTITGNVITDPGFEGEPDTIGDNGTTTLRIEDGGAFVDAGAGTTVNGSYGTLTIDQQGNFSYDVNPDPAFIGMVDEFAYSLVHDSGATSEASIFIRIDSPDVAILWSDIDPSAPGMQIQPFSEPNANLKELTANGNEGGVLTEEEILESIITDGNPDSGPIGSYTSETSGSDSDVDYDLNESEIEDMDNYGSGGEVV